MHCGHNLCSYYIKTILRQFLQHLYKFFLMDKIKPYLILPENIWHKFENQI